MAGPPLALVLLLMLSPPGPGTAEPRGPSERTLSCLAAAPSLAWYLDGERRPETEGSGGRLLVAAGAEGSGGSGGGGAFEAGSSSTFVVTTARRLQRPLNCTAVDPATGRVSSASVLLNVQFQPERVKVGAVSPEPGDGEPGLLLVLLVLVQAHPPANITWVDQDGQKMVSTSHFLIVDTKTYPWLTNHTIQLQLSSLAHNLSRPGDPRRVANASLPLPGLLGARVELPLLALVVGSAAAVGTFLCLGAFISSLVYRKGKKAAGLSLPAGLPPSDSNNLKPRMPRANMSLPANLQLNDLTPEMKAQDRADAAPVVEEEEERALSEPENSLVLIERGFGRFPMVGYIYRASSMSSDEIWL